MAIGEYTVQSEIDIGRPMEEVWAFVADPTSDPQWCHLVPDVALVGPQTDGHPRYTFIQQFGPIQRTGNGEIVSASPPTKLQGRAEVMGGEFRYTYRLESVDEGTRFTHTNEVRWGGPIRSMHSIQQRMTQRIMDRQLQTLKELLEKKRG